MKIAQLKTNHERDRHQFRLHHQFKVCTFATIIVIFLSLKMNLLSSVSAVSYQSWNNCQGGAKITVKSVVVKKERDAANSALTNRSFWNFFEAASKFHGTAIPCFANRRPCFRRNPLRFSVANNRPSVIP